MSTIFLTVKVCLKEGADPENVVSELDYEFTHPDIEDTEVIDWEEACG